MLVPSRARLAAACAALSTVVLIGMAAATVLAGDRSCDLSGCPPTAAFTVSAAVRTTTPEPTCPTPSGSPGTTASPVAPTASPDRTGPGSCADGGGPGRAASGGMATARVPAP